MSTNSDRPVVSVISPMYNEAAKIADAVRSMRTALEKLDCPWEFILVNDGSVDDSLSLAQQAAGDDPRVRIITYARNRGRGYAIRQGLACAGGQFIVVTEADLSWGTDIVFRLLEVCRRPGVDMVVASPHTKDGRLENVPPYRVFLTQFGNVLLRRLMPGGLTMYTGMTRAYRRHVLEAMDLESDGKELHLEIISKAYALGYKIEEIPAVLAWTLERRNEKRRFRAGGLIVSHLLHGVAESPMMVFGGCGGGLLGLGLLMGVIWLLVAVASSCRPSIGWPIVACTSVACGAVLIALGLIGAWVRDLRRLGYHVQRRQMELLRRGVESGTGTSGKT